MLLACHVDMVEKKFMTISHFETLQLFIYIFLIYVKNRTVIFQTYWNTLDVERCYKYNLSIQIQLMKLTILSV